MKWQIVSHKELEPHLFAEAALREQDVWYTVEQMPDSKYSVVKHIRLLIDIDDAKTAISTAEQDLEIPKNEEKEREEERKAAKRREGVLSARIITLLGALNDANRRVGAASNWSDFAWRRFSSG
jgi:hypothetical protein